jgi:hypothetical protein
MCVVVWSLHWVISAMRANAESRSPPRAQALMAVVYVTWCHHRHIRVRFEKIRQDSLVGPIRESRGGVDQIGSLTSSGARPRSLMARSRLIASDLGQGKET